MIQEFGDTCTVRFIITIDLVDQLEGNFSSLLVRLVTNMVSLKASLLFVTIPFLKQSFSDKKKSK